MKIIFRKITSGWKYTCRDKTEERRPVGGWPEQKQWWEGEKEYNEF